MSLIFSYNRESGRSEVVGVDWGLGTEVDAARVVAKKSVLLPCRFFKECQSSAKSLKWVCGGSGGDAARGQRCLEFCRQSHGIAFGARGGHLI
jgi:hypothetical protein